ncbi:Angiopoietin-1 receptor [Holothuria leucospilota]|uniref:receptor protein-tyrosine kinase n=1 Tax=Holothuria leucospilota TaxID=206669 RepID=A0A9Q1BH48_HOLLE|nr:Angiopoietin-1 receptor [Holothuria leucospilota]
MGKMIEEIVKKVLVFFMCLSALQESVKSVTGNLCKSYPLQKCCTGRLEHAVNEISVKVSYSLRNIENDTDNPWRLDAHVTWDPPNSEDNFQYAVNIDYTISPEDVSKGGIAATTQGICYRPVLPYYMGYPPQTCSFLPEERWHILNGTSFDVKDLYFGFQYRFLLRTFENGLPSANLTCIYKEPFHTPDCYQTTGDEDFCRTRVTALSSAPVNLTVTNTIYTKDAFGNDTLSLMFEWQEPLLVNGNISAYTAFLTNWNGKEDVGSPTVQVIWVDNSDLSNSSSVANLRYRILYTGFVLKEEFLRIVIYPIVDLNNEIFLRVSGTTRGTPAKMVFDPKEFLPETTTEMSSIAPQTAKTTEGEENTPFLSETVTLVLISGSLLLAIVISILLIIALAKYCGMKFNKPVTEQVFLPFHETHIVTHENKQSLVEPIFRGKEIFDYNNIEEQEIIGNGQYGVVIKGRALLSGKEKWIDVAIKKPKQAYTSGEILEDFKNEIRLMLELGNHPHIISVLGCCTIDQPYYLITDFMEYGDLLHFLQKCYDVQNNPPDPIYKVETLQQLQISHQIASGMDYVAGTRFFHGDLAARNILVGKDLWVKITDFGLTDSLYQKGYTRLNASKRRPYKWYGPEAIERQYCTLKTDIWSYGVVLWEIFTLGRETPYHGMTVQEVLWRLKRGYRLSQPSGCPATIYGLMQACWENDPDQRPSFGEILHCVEYILIKMGDQTNYILASIDDISEEDSSTDSWKSSLLNRIASLEDNLDNNFSSGYSSNTVFSDQSFETNSDYVATNESFVMEPILDEDFYDEDSVGDGYI